MEKKSPNVCIAKGHTNHLCAVLLCCRKHVWWWIHVCCTRFINTSKSTVSSVSLSNDCFFLCFHLKPTHHKHNLILDPPGINSAHQPIYMCSRQWHLGHSVEIFCTLDLTQHVLLCFTENNMSTRYLKD